MRVGTRSLMLLFSGLAHLCPISGVSATALPGKVCRTSPECCTWRGAGSALSGGGRAFTTTFHKECRAHSPNPMASGQAQLCPHPLSQHYSRAQVRYRVLSLECCSCGLGSAFSPVRDKDRGLISLTTPPRVREKGWG